MKVCHFIASAGIGRGEFYVDLVNELSKTVDVSIVIPQGALYRDRISRRVQVYEYRSADHRLNPFLYIELYRIFKEVQADIVHTHYAKAAEIYQRLEFLFPAQHLATKHNPRKGRIFNRLSHVIAVSAEVLESIQGDNATLIYNGIEFLPVVPPAREETFTVLAVGRLDKIKAFDRLLDECSRLDRDFRLRVVGEGEERAALEAQAQRLGLAGKVQFLGFRKDVAELMAAADLVVVCSHSEGFSLVIVEALFYAKLLISRRVGIAGEILPDNFIIEGFDIAEKIDKVIGNYDDYLREFKGLATTVRERFLLANVAAEYVNHYQRLVSL